MVRTVDSLRTLRSEFSIALDAAQDKFALWNICPMSKAQRDTWVRLQDDAPSHVTNMTEDDVRRISAYNKQYTDFMESLDEDCQMFMTRLQELMDKEKQDEENLLKMAW